MYFPSYVPYSDDASDNSLMFGDIVKVDSTYYLIVQCSYHKAILISLRNAIEWNRYREAVSVDWSTLTTDTFCDVFGFSPESTCEKVTETSIISFNTI